MLQVAWAQLLLCGWALGTELTFELPDNAKQCFYEDITTGTKCTLEFQVSRFVYYAVAFTHSGGLSCFTTQLPSYGSDVVEELV